MNEGAIEIKQQPDIKTISSTIGFMRDHNFGSQDF